MNTLLGQGGRDADADRDEQSAAHRQEHEGRHVEFVRPCLALERLKSNFSAKLLLRSRTPTHGSDAVSSTQPLCLRERATTPRARAETRARKMPAGGTVVASGTHLSIPQNTILGGPELVRPRPSQPCPPPRRCRPDVRGIHRPALSIHHSVQRWRARDVDNVLCARTVLLLLRLALGAGAHVLCQAG